MGYMSDAEQKRIFSINLLKYIENSGKQQKDVAIELDINPPTFNTWCTGKSIPPVSTIQKIAEYFNVGISNLVDEKPDDSQQSHYLDDDTAKMAQELKDNKELKLLFDASRDASPEDLKQTADYLMFLKKKERGE